MTPTPPQRPALSAELRQRTARAHRQAETRPFLLALAEGRVTRAGVLGLLQRLLPVYAALEDEALPARSHDDVAPLLLPGLARADRLRADLAALGSTAGTRSRAAAAYADDVRRAAALSPAAFVGHHYTRYLGDLSGGQVVAAALRAHPALGGVRLSFLDFPGLRGPAVRRAYREALDALPWSAAQREEAVSAAAAGFVHSSALADELAEEVLPGGEPSRGAVG